MRISDWSSDVCSSDLVNSGERYGGRVSLRWEPAEGLSITPRVLYQKVTTDGFNRQEVYNLYANQFTTTRPQVTFEERQQYLLLDEAFEDEVKLFDLTMNYTGDIIGVTSVTTYLDRHILVSRHATALTGSLSAEIGSA